MSRLAATHSPLGRAGLLLLMLAGVLLWAPSALAADGVPLSPPGLDGAFTSGSMEDAVLSGAMLAFEFLPLGPSARAPHTAAKENPIIYGWNTSDGTNWALGKEVAGWNAAMMQADPAVLDLKGTVYIVWSQRKTPVGQADLWLWKGSRSGGASPGYPRLLVAGPADTNQTHPDLGIVTLGGGHEAWLAWQDDRDTGGATTEIYVLDLSADTNHNGAPDFEEAGYDPVAAGLRMDPSGSLLLGQADPAVGPKGVFWLDHRDAASSGAIDIWRGQPLPNEATAGKFCDTPAGSEKLNLCATASGAAWLGPGIAGGPHEPWGKNLGRAAKILCFLGDPGEFDASGTAYALTGRHGGTTDLDRDIFYFSPSLRQSLPVCDRGSKDYDHTLTQAMPAVSTAPGGYRVVWSDARGPASNSATTPENDLAYWLYVALIPKVSLAVNHVSAHVGQTLTLSSLVTPNFTGRKVRLQRGTRHTFAGFGTNEWFDSWVTLDTKTLNGSSKAKWSWTPTKKGTYWLRAWFVGGKRYVDVASAGRKVPHVPMSSRIARIIVN